MSTSMNHRAIGFVLAALLGGCGDGLYLADDEGAPRETGPFLGRRPDALSLPYALGAAVQIHLRGTDEDQTDWRLVSDAPAVLRVEASPSSRHQLSADCVAAGEGEARIRVIDAQGEERRSARVTVKAPDRAELYPHGPMRIQGRDQSSIRGAALQEVRILENGRGVFGVAYFRGPERVYGHGLATIEEPGLLGVEAKTTSGVVTNEWLFVTPQKAGRYELKLAVGGRRLATLPVIAVAEAELQSLVLLEEAIAKRDENTSIFVLAQTRDGAGRDVYGAYSRFSLDGAPQPGPEDRPTQDQGDLYRYSYSAKVAPREVVASRGNLRAAVKIQAQKGYVTNTTYLGCSVGGGRASPAPFAALAGILAILWLHRRVWRRG